jgi:uncharacterized membrane protein
MPAVDEKRRCEVCGRSFPSRALVPAEFVRDPVQTLLKEICPAWSSESFVCMADLNRLRVEYVERSLTEERGELTELERDVVESLKQLDLVASNPVEDFDRQVTVGERVADRVASFGGSWTFLICFAAVLFGWILLNTAALFAKPFDPFPFILLNLVLSCLAAIQAPVIMMSQNRQEAKDRLRSEHDYRVNLKAELEIRHLHSKLDLLMNHQWHRLLEVQRLQTELLQQIAAERAERTDD